MPLNESLSIAQTLDLLRAQWAYVIRWKTRRADCVSRRKRLENPPMKRLPLHQLVLKATCVALAGLSLLAASSAHGAAQAAVRLVLESSSARPGETIMAGVHLKMPAGWHSYWANSGDSGLPTKVTWNLPAGVTAGEIRWPAPEKLEEAGFTTYVLHDDVVLLVPLTLASNLPNGPLTLSAKVDWQECKESCVLGSGEYAATLQIGSETRASADAALIEQARKRLPMPGESLKAQARWDGSATGDDRPVRIEFVADQPGASWEFFPYKGTNFDVAVRRSSPVPGTPSRCVRK